MPELICPNCNTVVKCPSCIDYTCPNCGEDLEEEPSLKWPDGEEFDYTP